MVQTFFGTHNHFPARTMHMGKLLMPFKVGVNIYYSRSHHDFSSLIEKIHHSPNSKIISAPEVLHLDMGGSKEEKGKKM